MESLSAPLAVPVVPPPAVAFRLASDARLTRLAAAGSEGALAAIFERHHQALHRYCHSIVGNSHDAADALQNTMIKALRALPGERRQIELRPWLYRIAHNESISLLRARRADSDLDAAAHVSDPAAADAVDSRERLRSLTDDLGELTERQRGALLMRELSGLEFTEVADALGTSAAAVKQSVYEARCALQAMQEGRAMDCDAVRRTLSDGDRRMLRGMRMRGHLRACAGCSDFQAAMHRRPAQLSAMIPPLPLGVAAAMLHGIVGGTGSGGGGGAFAAGIAGTAKATTGFSFGAKAAAVVAASATLAGGAVYAVPELKSASPQRSTPSAGRVDAAHSFGGAMSATANISSRRQRSGASADARSSRDRPAASVDTAARADRPTGDGVPAGTPGGKPTGTPGGKPAGTPGAGKPAGTPVAGKPAGTPGAGKPAGIPGPPAGAPGGEPAATPGPPADVPGVGIASTLGASTLGASAAATHGRP